MSPPAECHSPELCQPSPPEDAPAPGRAWNMCQMKSRPERGSRPLRAMRSRLPHAAIVRSGHAGARAVTTASMISWPQWEVDMVTGAQSSGQTIVPRFATISTGRMVPSFLAISGSRR